MSRDAEVPPLVTVLIPARNEAADIEACLQAVLAQDHALHRIQVVVVDGDSDDDTADRARRALEGRGLAGVVVHRNPGGATPANLNAGLALADGEVLCRVDARSLVPPDYVRRCAEVLVTQPGVAVVGGAQVAVPRDGSPRALGIARALNNRYGMGLARYRRGAASGPADTVYLGSFRTAQLREVGGWDERFATNQDFELNRRMARVGTVWFEAGLDVGYRARPTLAALWRQYRRFGSWKVRYWTVTGDRPQVRQIVLLAGPPVALGVAAVAWRQLPRRARPVVVAAAVGGVAVVEGTGPSGPGAPLAGHVVSAAASAVVATAWWSGVVEAFARLAVRRPPRG